uniref:Twin-arginine translocation signal domain-containing protein n=1 Tax=Globodera pallida TaxID=36090 RepID=A0A183C6G9_GLOPA
MKNGEKKSQAVGPSKANGTSNFLKTAAVGGLLGGGIGLANGAQPAAPSGASFNNNLTTATNQHLFKPSNGYTNLLNHRPRPMNADNYLGRNAIVTTIPAPRKRRLLFPISFEKSRGVSSE